MDSVRKTALFPGLASLGLCPEAWNALAEQGSLCAEACRAGSVYKLRFRLGGKQQSRYVGKRPGFIDLIRHELARVQAESRSRQRLRRLLREARQCLRRTKRQVEPLLSSPYFSPTSLREVVSSVVARSASDSSVGVLVNTLRMNRAARRSHGWTSGLAVDGW